MTFVSRRAPRVASSLIRRTFPSPVVTPDLCHMQWHGASRSALPPVEARSQWRLPLGTLCFLTTSSTHFLSASRLSRPYTNQADLMLPSLTRNSLLRADCLPHSLFKVSFPWWRHLLLSFFNLVLRFAVVPSTWKSILVVLVIKRDGDPTSLDSYRPISRILRFQSFRAPDLCSHCAPHSSTTRPFPGRFPLVCRRYGLQSCGHLALPPP